MKKFDIYTDIKHTEAADPHTGGVRTMNVSKQSSDNDSSINKIIVLFK